tara:strand:+ start:19650 stop:20039 length:390 start_codon:yes stop_codon:yes gene_type:complete
MRRKRDVKRNFFLWEGPNKVRLGARDQLNIGVDSRKLKEEKEIEFSDQKKLEGTAEELYDDKGPESQVKERVYTRDSASLSVLAQSRRVLIRKLLKENPKGALRKHYEAQIRELEDELRVPEKFRYAKK